DDVANSGLPVIARHRVNVLARRRDAGQMRGRFERGFQPDPAHRRMRALARRSAGPISHRDEARPQWLEAFDFGPQALLHLLRLRREEFERDARRAGVEIADRIGGEQSASMVLHQWSSPSTSAAGEARRTSGVKYELAASRFAVQITTVNGSPGKCRAGTGTRPAARHHSATSASAKPSRR